LSFLVIGSSHAGKVGRALWKAGHHTDVIYEPNWRAVKANMAAMTEKVRDKLERTRVDAVVYFILDNSVYYSMDDNGDLSPPQRDKNGDSTLYQNSIENSMINH
jgi:hypothetical protein